ncbi:MAG: universal stress protein [Bauldia sp.]|nr:universal stress protein [Bauldia sp.]
MSETHPVTDIVLATDMDARCDRALLRAFALARRWNARLHIALVVAGEPRPSWDDARIAHRAAEDVAALAQGAVADVSWRVVVRTAPVSDAICDVAEATGAQLIVTGAALNEMLGKSRPGQIIAALIRTAKAPVLIAKRPVGDDYRALIAPTDFSDVSEDAIARGVALFPDSALTILHAYRLPFSAFLGEQHKKDIVETAMQQTVGFVHRLGDRLDFPQPPSILLEEGNPDSLLHSVTTEQPFDLTVLGVHGAFDLDRHGGDLAGRLLLASACDVLAVPARGAE